MAKEVVEHWRAFEEGASDGADAVDTTAFHLAHIAFLRDLQVLAPVPVHAGKVAARPTDAAIEHAIGVVKTALAG